MTDLTRVKVYQLDNEGVWEDKGTGHVAISELVWIHVEHEAPPASEEDGPLPLLLKTKIKKDVDFIRQQDTLIVWTEDDGRDMALSFQDQDGCCEMWNTIRDIKKQLNGTDPDGDSDLPRRLEGSQPYPILSLVLIQNRLFPPPEDESPPDDPMQSDTGIVLPKPSMATIKEIEETLFAASKGAYGRAQLGRAVLQDNYPEKLIPLLEMCEDLESLDELYSLSHIVKLIVFLNDPKIYEIILKDDVFPYMMGMLEYDREYPAAKSNYRHQTQTAQFKQLLPIPDATIASKIIQTYRLLFLRDTALARMLDDATYASLNSMVFCNQVDIVGWFVVGAGEEYLAKMIGVLNQEEDVGEEAKEVKREDVVLFLHELSGVAKGMQVTLRANYYRTMAKLGLFAIFDYTLVHEEIKVRLAATAILASILDHDPSLVRSFCLAQMKQNQPQLLINLLIDRFLHDPDPGLQSQLCELIRIILETDDASTLSSAVISSDSEINSFLDLFYDKCILLLAAPMYSFDATTVVELRDPQSTLCAHICSLLSFIVKSHSYRSKYYILGNSITMQIVHLLRAPETHVKLAALRFFRTCVGMKDEFYNRHLVKCDFLGAVVACWEGTGGKYNLLNSACLDVFEYVRKENIKSLVSNLVQNHKAAFENVTYVSTFKDLILRYEQNQEGPVAGLGADDESTKPSAASKPDGYARIDNDEEAYFNDSDDDESSTSTTSPTTKQPASPRPAADTPVSIEPCTTPPRATTGGKTVPSAVVLSISTENVGNPSPRMKRSASPLGLVDYEDDEEDEDVDMFEMALSKKKTLASPVSGVPPPPVPVVVNGGGGKISFSLNKVAGGGVGLMGPGAGAKRRRTGSFSGVEEVGMDT
ncbi:Platinum sensitivity protein [Podochytrium sp. JEL0797]|nr:Platinum sensitivity protein [Podochytrium sp. JEL0797]